METRLDSSFSRKNDQARQTRAKRQALSGALILWSHQWTFDLSRFQPHGDNVSVGRLSQGMVLGGQCMVGPCCAYRT